METNPSDTGTGDGGGTEPVFIKVEDGIRFGDRVDSNCSVVYLYKDLAIKVFKRYRYMRREVAAYRRLESMYGKAHPRFLNLVHIDEDRLRIATKSLDMDLFEYLRTMNPDPKARTRLVLQVAEALGMMHRANLVHMDVKVENVFITSAGDAVLGDLGSTVFQDANVTPRFGSPGYQAPELALNIGRDDILIARPSMDAWSLGVLAYAVANETFPYATPDDLSRIEPFCPPQLYAVTKTCLVPDPTLRPNPGDLVDLYGGPDPRDSLFGGGVQRQYSCQRGNGPQDLQDEDVL